MAYEANFDPMQYAELRQFAEGIEETVPRCIRRAVEYSLPLAGIAVATAVTQEEFFIGFESDNAAFWTEPISFQAEPLSMDFSDEDLDFMRVVGSDVTSEDQPSAVVIDDATWAIIEGIAESTEATPIEVLNKCLHYAWNTWRTRRLGRRVIIGRVDEPRQYALFDSEL